MIPSTSIGASIVAQGIDWREGDEVLLCDNEFPANAVPWYALRTRGVRVRLLSTLERAFDARSPASRNFVAHAGRHGVVGLVCRRLPPRSRGVERRRARGRRAALRGRDPRAGRAASERRAIPAPTRCTRAPENGCSGCTAIGLLYVREDLIDRFALDDAGLALDARHVGFPRVRAAIRAGSDAFRGRNAEHRRDARAGEVDRTVRTLRPGGDRTPRAAPHRSSLRPFDAAGAVVASPRGRRRLFRHRDVSDAGTSTASKLGRALQRAGIVTTYRPTGVRVAPHGYNTAEEIDRLVDAARGVAAGSSSRFVLANGARRHHGVGHAVDQPFVGGSDGRENAAERDARRRRSRNSTDRAARGRRRSRISSLSRSK